MPPLLIFPRQKKRQEFELGLPPGAWIAANDSGWMTMEVFFEWFKKFIKFSGAKKETPVLLLFDGHASHTKNIDVIDLARDNGVILLFPTALFAQAPAFRCGIYETFKSILRRWLRSNPAETTNIPIAETEIAPTQVTQVDDFPENNSFNDPSTPPPRELKETSNETQNGSLPWMSDTPIAPIKKVITSSYPAVSPEAFMPVPKLMTTVKRVQRKRQNHYYYRVTV
ncbi:unnamed protein product [Acanthoscelides obtectus]|uniref:DDE-1 domain-containing protein n=1 Tax=Acanthoscelides obtectus TaxID=200917 RepID=A0A9P0QAF5_ACAOB|nr:unnamed protein product [Acanthoscelides obtectus]CAK1624330.1 hypothetical protein AOBTE_LOCUS2501 [Acanthoscelides obtectus]